MAGLARRVCRSRLCVVMSWSEQNTPSASFPALLIAALAAAALLSGCVAEDASQSDEKAPPSQDASANSALSAESLTIAETAWLSISETGEVFTTYLDADGRYRDERGGELVYSGTWEQNADLELCYAPTKGKGDCWIHGAPGKNGVMRATNGDGRAIEVRKVAYQPPKTAPQTDSADPTEGAADTDPDTGPDNGPDNAQTTDQTTRKAGN